MTGNVSVSGEVNLVSIRRGMAMLGRWSKSNGTPGENNKPIIDLRGLVKEYEDLGGTVREVLAYE